jgi:FkbM family methyltransferase
MARYAGKVSAVEANPQVADFARTVAARNVKIIKVALSATAGRATLKVPLNSAGGTLDELATIDPGNPLQGRDAAGTAVETKTLDSFEISNCSLIKIDVEGHEEAVLDGASALIAAQRPILMLELDESLNKGALARLTARYAALNYRAFFLSLSKLRPVGEFDPVRHQNSANLKPRHKLPRGTEYINNFVFIPEEKTARILARL